MGKFLDIGEYRQECSDEEFANLYDCEESDDTAGSFPWSMIASARVDSFYTWKDFKAAEIDIPVRLPFGERPVSIGYDPNKQGRDDAALAVFSLPDRPSVMFPFLHKIPSSFIVFFLLPLLFFFIFFSFLFFLFFLFFFFFFFF